MLNKLTEKTLIPLGLALFAIGGAAAWATTLHLNTMRNSENLAIISVEQKSYSESLYAIKQDIAIIKGELKRINK